VTSEQDFLLRLQTENAVLVTVQSYRGSVPREVGAWMAVFAQACMGTIGGGHLEWNAIEQARLRLQNQPGEVVLQRYALGSTLGQCCGGEVVLQFESLVGADSARLSAGFAKRQAQWPLVAIVGGGHVGQALVHVLGSLPWQVQWIDSRDEIFPEQLPGNVQCEHSDPVQQAIATLTPQSCVLIMSFSHAEDLDVVAACLLRQRHQADLPFIGLIGSRSKWHSFRHRLVERGFSAQELDVVRCPIGLPGIRGKEPAVIAVAVAAQLLLEIGCIATTHDKNVRNT
jgi:xanthine dehydrogenase accessory factor